MEEEVTEPRLDSDQMGVVAVASDVRQVVIAGPGSGKTEVVSALVEHLVDEEDVDPTYGMLVISFSNAAVHAADARLRTRGTGPVTVQTMDSLAGDILRDLSTRDNDRLDFDGRIALAVELLEAEGWDRIDDLEHLIVDEVQDVVGVRADFLIAFIERLPKHTGFTLLGDPAQGIYDFQIRPDSSGRKPRSTTTSSLLVDAIAAQPDVDIKHLTGQYRATSRDTKAAVALREAVLPGGDPTRLDDFYAEVVHAGTVVDVAHRAERWQGRTAFLTATNGQALLVAGDLRAHGHVVELRRSAQQRVLAPWIGRLLEDAPTDAISRTEIDARVRERTPDLDPGVLWRALRATVAGKGTQVDLGRLAQRLRALRPLVPDLLDSPRTQFVVSTVHRAKGLEFENVVLVDFAQHPWLHDASDPGELLRTRFVALTRAGQRLVRADGPDDRSVRRFSDRRLHAERWYIRGPKRWMTFGFEIGVTDFEPTTRNQPRIHQHLATRVSAGDMLELRLDPDESSLTRPVYSIVHDGVEVARTSWRFGEDLALRIGTLEFKKGSWPALSGGRVESVATVVTDVPRGNGAYEHGLCLAPIVTGLLDIDWKGSESR